MGLHNARRNVHERKLGNFLQLSVKFLCFYLYYFRKYKILLLVDILLDTVHNAAQWEPTQLLKHIVATMERRPLLELCCNSGNRGYCWLTMTFAHIATMNLGTTAAFHAMVALL
jgi:hypothetical protein